MSIMQQIKQIDIREQNLKNVYDYVLHSSGASRAKIAKALELSRPSSSSLVDELLSMGALFEDGKEEGERGVGRTPIVIRADFRRHFCIVLFWKPKRISASVVSMAQDKSGAERVWESLERPVSFAEEYGKCSLRLLRDFKNKYEKAYGKDKYLGSVLVLPGIVDPLRRAVLSHPLGINLETGRRIISEIEESGENSVGILNDNAILGYAAMQRLNLQDKNFLYINLSTGIGAAYFMKGEIFGDAGGKLTQFGHIIVHPGGSLCSCGAHGCLEAEIGERALQEQFASYFGKEELKPLLEGELLRKIIDGRKKANGIYTAVKDKFLKDLSLAISNVSTMVFPDLILLGGFFSLWGEDFLEELKEEINRIGFSYIMQDLHLLYSREEKEELQAAAADYFFSRYFHFTERKIEGIHLG